MLVKPEYRGRETFACNLRGSGGGSGYLRAGASS